MKKLTPQENKELDFIINTTIDIAISFAVIVMILLLTILILKL